MSMNKVNMSLDEIINNSRRNKRPLEVIKGQRGMTRNRNNFSNRKNFNSRNESSRGRFIRGRGRTGGRGAPRIRGRYNSYTRYNNYENRDNKRPSPRIRFRVRRNYVNSKDEAPSTRIHVSNLHKDIINSELKNIFSRIGPLKRCGIHWDSMGNSKGSADIEYERPEDARKAIDEFNNAEVDGLPMRVSISKGGFRRRVFRRRIENRNSGSNSRKININ